MNKVFIKIINIYQKTLSPDHGNMEYNPSIGCRFYPSCSEYSKQAFNKYGVMKGIIKSFLRILRCNPFFKGGIDYLK